MAALHPSTVKSIRRFAETAPTTRLLYEIDHHRKMAETYPKDAERCNAIADLYQELYAKREFEFISTAVPSWYADVCTDCGYHHGTTEDGVCPDYVKEDTDD